MIYGFLLALALPAAATEAPFFQQELQSQTDVGAVNQNFRNTADAQRRADLTNGGTVDGTLIVDTLCFNSNSDCQTTAATSVTSCDTTVSTRTFNWASGNTTQTTMVTALAGTTIQLTVPSSGGPYYPEIEFNCTMDRSAAGNSGANPMIDGRLYSMNGTTVAATFQPMWPTYIQTVSETKPIGFSVILSTPLGAGAHNFSVVLVSKSAGTTTCYGPNNTQANRHRVRLVKCTE